MTKDDKHLRDTILAELKRRRGLLSESMDRSSNDHGDGSQAAVVQAERRRQSVGQQ